MRPLIKNWPVLVAIAAFAVAVAVLRHESIAANYGSMTYALDDAYIHMAMARNTAEYGVFGVSNSGFSFSSSSPLWTGLLALVYAATGPNEWAPLALNVAAGVLLLGYVNWLLVRAGASSWVRALSLLAVVCAPPLPVMALTGLEHILHTLLTIVAIALMARTADPRSGRSLVPLAVVFALLVSTRYEGLFLVFVGCGLLALRRRRAAAVTLAIAAIMPVLVIGLAAVSHGWYVLPNSVLLKSYPPRFDSIEHLVAALGGTAIRKVVNHRDLLVLVLPALLLLASARGLLPRDRGAQRTMLVCFVGAMLLHLQFAETGYLYRYEAYLVATGIAVLSLWSAASIQMLPGRPRPRPGRAEVVVVRVCAIAALGAIVALPLAGRSVRALRMTVPATMHVFQQQVQMARFLDEHFAGEVVAANDIGAIAYFADVEILDLFGLANMEVAKSKRAGSYDGERMAALVQEHGCKIAVVYDKWFPQLPPAWTKVREWQLPKNVAVGGDTVAFYATNASEVNRVTAALDAFEAKLPDGIRVLHPEPQGGGSLGR